MAEISRALGGSPDQDNNSMTLFPGIDDYGPSMNAASVGMWSDQSAMFYLPNDVLENSTLYT